MRALRSAAASASVARDRDRGRPDAGAGDHRPVGMLGNGDAAPALVRLAIRDKNHRSRLGRAPRPQRGDQRRAGNGGAAHARSIANSAAALDLQLAALSALARLGNPRAGARVRALCRARRGPPISGHRDLGPGPSFRRADGAGADQGARRPTGQYRGGRLSRAWPPGDAGLLQPLFFAGRRSEAADRDETRRHHRAWPRVRAQRRHSRCRVARARRAPRLRQSRSRAGGRDGAGLVARSARVVPAARARAAAAPVRPRGRERAAGSAGGVAGNRGAPRRSAPARRTAH